MATKNLSEFSVSFWILTVMRPM